MRFCVIVAEPNLMATEVNRNLSANLKMCLDLAWINSEMQCRTQHLVLKKRLFIYAANNYYHSTEELKEAFH